MLLAKLQYSQTTSTDSNFGTSFPSLSLSISFMNFLTISFFLEIIILVCSLFYFKNNPVFDFIYINLHRRIICYSLVFFNNVLKIILNVSN